MRRKSAVSPTGHTVTAGLPRPKCLLSRSFCTDNNTLAFLDQPPASDASCRPLGDPGRLSEYLNRADVRAALGVRPGKQLAEPWTDCVGGTAGWNYTPSNVDVLQAYVRPVQPGGRRVFPEALWGTGWWQNAPGPDRPRNAVIHRVACFELARRG